jgi:hypothetical protein
MKEIKTTLFEANSQVYFFRNRNSVTVNHFNKAERSRVSYLEKKHSSYSASLCVVLQNV